MGDLHWDRIVVVGALAPCAALDAEFDRACGVLRLDHCGNSRTDLPVTCKLE